MPVETQLKITREIEAKNEVWRREKIVKLAAKLGLQDRLERAIEDQLQGLYNWVYNPTVSLQDNRDDGLESQAQFEHRAETNYKPAHY